MRRRLVLTSSGIPTAQRDPTNHTPLREKVLETESLGAGSDDGTLAHVDLSLEFARRAKTVPMFFVGPFRNALRLALEEATAGSHVEDLLRQERGWKLFLLLPRMLLHRGPRGGLISRDKLARRFEVFAVVNGTSC